VEESIRFRAPGLLLVLFLLTAFNAAFGGKKAPKLAETIDLPPTFEVDFQLAANQRAHLGPQREVPDDIAGRIGQEVFDSLVKTQMISGFGLPYTWTFRPYDSPVVNAFSLADGEVVALTGLSRLIGTNRGLWAAVLAHEISHVARRHSARKALFHQYVEGQVRYWQMRARLGDEGAGWTALAVQIAGNLAEKKLSRDLEHDADIQGMMLMARAGYHPDNAFAMHHLLRMNTTERSRIGTFFFSDHPRWESRDQRTERAYTEALAEYNRLWTNPETSPGGAPPAVAFLGDTRGVENKGGGTGDLTLALSCRNVGSPVDLVIHLTKRDGAPVGSLVSDYRGAAGNVLIHERAACVDADGARSTIVHIPTAIIAAQDRRLKAQVEIRGPGDEVLERSKVFDVHFPKTDRNTGTTIAKVRVEPGLGDTTGDKQVEQYKIATAVPPVADNAERPAAGTPLAPPVKRSIEEVAAAVAVRAVKANGEVVVSAFSTRAELTKTDHPPNTATNQSLGVLPSALDSSGVPSHWSNSLAPTSAATWWQVSPPAEPTLKMRLSRSVIWFDVRPLDTESQPETVVITNNTPAALTISGIQIQGSDSTDFTETTDCGRTIEAGATCTLSLVFKPHASGTRSGTLTMDGTGQKIFLTGVGK
jgi:hypothetical protein